MWYESRLPEKRTDGASTPIMETGFAATASTKRPDLAESSSGDGSTDSCLTIKNFDTQGNGKPKETDPPHLISDDAPDLHAKRGDRIRLHPKFGFDTNALCHEPAASS